MNEISSTNWLLATIAAGLATVALALIYFASIKEGKRR